MMSTVIVTGASSGIGAAVAERFFHEGWTVHAWDLEPGTSENYRWMTVDVTDIETLLRAAREVESAEAVIACAGIASRGPVIKQDPSEWRRVVQINLEGTLATGVATFEAMSRSGAATFVTIGSVAGVNGFYQRAIYSASKAGVLVLADGAVAELALAPQVGAVGDEGVACGRAAGKVEAHRSPPGVPGLGVVIVLQLAAGEHRFMLGGRVVAARVLKHRNAVPGGQGFALDSTKQLVDVEGHLAHGGLLHVVGCPGGFTGAPGF